MRKHKSNTKLFINVSGKDVGFTLITMFLAIYMFAIAFVTYGKVENSDLNVVTSKMTSVTYTIEYRKYYVVISSADGKQYYYVESNRNEAKEIVKDLQENFVGKEITFSYTDNKRLFVPDIFYDYERLVSLSDGDFVRFGLELYNQNNNALRIMGIVFAVMVALCGFFLGLPYTVIKNVYNRKKYSKLRRKHRLSS